MASKRRKGRGFVSKIHRTSFSLLRRFACTPPHDPDPLPLPETPSGRRPLHRLLFVRRPSPPASSSSSARSGRGAGGGQLRPRFIPGGWGGRPRLALLVGSAPEESREALPPHRQSGTPAPLPLLLFAASRVEQAAEPALPPLHWSPEQRTAQARNFSSPEPEQQRRREHETSLLVSP